ncbi:putative F-box protein [Dorcoceras hygrometricum]|uniref:Putative F-box protein n=1 Tax=Dorcoceras hygrometricum TaxID=472368 RepID=A0A2Z7BS28_9LAMI|nr:putative F-box protein [Dorcoceras hygrometricum]
MATLKSTSLLNSSMLCSSSSRQKRIVRAAINIPQRVTGISLPEFRTNRLDELELHDSNGKRRSPIISIDMESKRFGNNGADPLVMAKIYAILEAVADRVEMHNNIGDQRAHWNSLLLNSINAITLVAAMMAGIAAISAGAPAVALKLSSTALYVAATGMLSIVNKIQPSQLAEEQRNASRLFKQLQNQIQTMICVGNPTAVDVKELMEKVLALDKAYPLPLLGVMLEKFPETVEPAVWWPTDQRKSQSKGMGWKKDFNCWNEKLEEDMREIVKVMRVKDREDYLTLANKALKLNKILASTAPVLTGLAALGSAFVGSPTHGGCAVMLAILGGALATVVNAFEHGGQVGMVFEMYRSNAGFFKLMEESIESNLAEEDLERRENGELFEMKVCLQLGRSMSELRDLATASSIKGSEIDEFASKLF